MLSKASFVMLNEVKHLANVSFQVPARDSSDATLCQNDTQREGKAFMDNCYIISYDFIISVRHTQVWRTVNI